MTEHSNPYESPKAVPGVKHDEAVRSASLVRGVAYSVPYGLLGLLVPFLYFLMLSVFRSVFMTESELFVSDYDWNGLLAPSVGCCVVFALASMRNYSPAHQIGMLRSLMWVGGSFIVGGFVSGIFTIVFGLEAVSYASDPYVWLRMVIALAVPTLYGCWVVSAELKVSREHVGANAA